MRRRTLPLLVLTFAAAALTRAAVAPGGAGGAVAVGASFVTLVASGLAIADLARAEARWAQFATPALFGLIVLWAWEILVVGFRVPEILLPSPGAIGRVIAGHYPVLAEDFRQTVLRSALPGYLAGCGAGFLVGLVMDRSPFLRRGLLPLGNLMSAMPIVAIVPIMVMWFGFGWESKAAVVVLMTFFPMLVSTTAGLAEAGMLERDLMTGYAASYRTTLLKLRLPAAMPHLFTALKLNSTLALIGAVVAEFFGTPIMGMGFRISTDAARLQMGMVWATITVAALTGSLAFGAIALIERGVTFWHLSSRTSH